MFARKRFDGSCRACDDKPLGTTMRLARLDAFGDTLVQRPGPSMRLSLLDSINAKTTSMQATRSVLPSLDAPSAHLVLLAYLSRTAWQMTLTAIPLVICHLRYEIINPRVLPRRLQRVCARVSSKSGTCSISPHFCRPCQPFRAIRAVRPVNSCRMLACCLKCTLLSDFIVRVSCNTLPTHDNL